ncbi:T9SS type A sorting domain-containing protein [Saccharicrinis sp. FJH54]|uniref:T9SS type A sorting domain-containing protein n=1 Tax=Saccharicrinis sp. FJH54 TaxID=3344665 RepID=UPI0035D3E098
MKNFTFLVAIVCIAFVSFGTVSAQDGTVYTDDFSTGHDYLTDGFDGTIWQGILLNDTVLGSTGMGAAELSVLNTNDDPGVLTYTSARTAWSTVADNGALLYRNIKSGADFEMSVKIVDGDFLSFGLEALVEYFMPGLMVKVKDETTYVLVQAFDIYDWGAIYGVRDIFPAEGMAEENWIKDDDSANPVSIASYPYIKLEKYGNEFIGYYSADGEIWYEIYTAVKPEVEGKDLQVGLYSATYTTNSATVKFDDFKLIDYDETSAIKKVSTSSPVSSYSTNSRVIVRNNSGESMGSVKLYSIDGAMVYSAKAIDAQRIEIPVSNNGIYIMDATVNGNRYTQKVVVR